MQELHVGQNANLGCKTMKGEMCGRDYGEGEARRTAPTPRMLEQGDNDGESWGWGGWRETYRSNIYTNTDNVSPSACSASNSHCWSLWQPLTFEAHLDKA